MESKSFLSFQTGKIIPSSQNCLVIVNWELVIKLVHNIPRKDEDEIMNRHWSKLTESFKCD